MSGPSETLAVLQQELAQRQEQLAEHWGVDLEQAQRMLALLVERLPAYGQLRFIGAGGMGEV